MRPLLLLLLSLSGWSSIASGLPIQSVQVFSVSIPMGTPNSAWYRTLVTLSFPVTEPSQAAEMADLNGDGAGDIVLAIGDRANPGQTQVRLNAGDGSLLNVVARLDSAATADIAVADFDGNGTPDVVEANGEGLVNGVIISFADQLWLSFQEGPELLLFNNAQSLGTAPSSAVAAGDLDGDGDQDLLFGKVNGEVVVFINQGRRQGGAEGDFLPGQVLAGIPGAGPVLDVTMADFNQDGFSDAGWIRNGVVELALVSAQGFLTVTETVQTAAPSALALGDLNGDGRPDLVVADSQQSFIGTVFAAGNRLSVTPFQRQFPEGITSAAAIADADGTGLNDIFLGRVDQQFASSPGALADVWLNQSPVDANFIHRQQCFLKVFGGVSAMTVGDLDSDGDTDLFFVVNSGLPSEVLGVSYLNGPITNQEGCCAAESAQRILRGPLTGPARKGVGLPAIELPVLRQFRDQTMQPRADGSRLVDHFFALTTDLLQVLNGSFQLRFLTNDLLRVWQPNINALVAGNGASVTVTQLQIDLADSVLAVMASEGSQALADVIADERLRLPPFDQLTGLDMDSFAQQLLGSTEPALFADGFEATQ